MSKVVANESINPIKPGFSINNATTTARNYRPFLFSLHKVLPFDLSILCFSFFFVCFSALITHTQARAVMITFFKIIFYFVNNGSGCSFCDVIFFSLFAKFIINFEITKFIQISEFFFCEKKN